MSKELEALKCLEGINNYLNNVYDYKEIKEEIQKDINTIKQALLKAQEQEKILNIIKEKNVDIYVLKTCISLEHYNSEIRLKKQNNTYSYEIWYELTQEEFNSIKEMFKDE